MVGGSTPPRRSMKKEMKMEKIYIVVRPDMPPGLQAAQACHAMREFVDRHPAIDRKWFRESNNIVILNARSFDQLGQLVLQACAAEVAHAPFYEADLDDELTAVAIGPAGTKLVSQLPLALRVAA